MRPKNDVVLGLLLPIIIALGTGLTIAFYKFFSVLTFGYVAWALFILCLYIMILQYESQGLRRIR